MLHLIPARLHRAAYRAAHALRVQWWRWRRPVVRGCRALAIDAEGRVLLIRHSYGSKRWLLPGGGMKRGEDPVAAAVRELREETGCALIGALLVASCEDRVHGAPHHVHVVAGLATGQAAPDGREVVDARFFDPAALPPDLPGPVAKLLPIWIDTYRRSLTEG